MISYILERVLGVDMYRLGVREGRKEAIAKIEAVVRDLRKNL